MNGIASVVESLRMRKMNADWRAIALGAVAGERELADEQHRSVDVLHRAIHLAERIDRRYLMATQAVDLNQT